MSTKPANKTIEWHTDEEDAEITRQAMEEGTLLSDEQLANMQTLDESPLPEFFKQAAKKRGRPRSANPKVQMTIRFSPEVVRYFRATGPGWQTRMDEALQEWIRLHAE